MSKAVNSIVSQSRTIRPIAASAIYGIAAYGDKLWAIDPRNGYLLEIDPLTDNTRILNSKNTADFIGVTGLAIAENTLWFTRDDNVYFCNLINNSWQPQLFIRLYYPADGIAVWQNTIYITCQKTGEILIYSRKNGEKITHFYLPGIGINNITLRNEEIWLADDLEQTVYCLEKATGETIFSVLTPFESPTGLTFFTNTETGEETLYIAYANREIYIRDNPNADPSHELQYRDRTFIHPLHFYYNQEQKYALSNGYLVEVLYTEEIAPLDPIELPNLEWRIALPAETDRQKIREITSIGLPFTEEVNDGQRIAVFKFDKFNSEERYIFGWKAILEVWSIKYQITPLDCENEPELSSEYQQKYLVDNDNLAMDKDLIISAASDAIGRETNILRKVYSIRNYVYDKLRYGIRPHIDTPDIVLKRGVGSCGEYLGLLLALCRINGIATRTVGRYKCPPHPQQKNLPLLPDFNHVWMEFYLPNFGWLPMESNPDDIIEGGPYPTRFFMGLAWYHAEMGKGVPFTNLTSNGLLIDKEQVSIGELAINHVRFIILDELKPS
ncbi:Transglutaminase domain-containing protein [Hyella patelloides LEGE 07179]|uniref:Transglutaminase domain-containing protein n=1 Tax=Hyella patelloides LEGE 07179 TaxID=945734 RepID=A0A563VN11_9CYAN|nr:transglutaminase domain-containing protein [Hyella patelloides]VEP12723.1 Transglutaminase domain-containing protein [Hyella patelloides LEGE 07179]